MTDSEKIINETKRYILEVFKSGLNKQQQTALKLKNGIDLFIGKQFADIEILKNEIINRCEEELNEYYNIESGNQVFRKRIDIIRDEFKKFVKNLNPQFIDSQQLPFERRLNNLEAKKLTENLKDLWDFDAWRQNNYYWEPLAKTDNKNPLIYFNVNIFNDIDLDLLKKIIQKLSGDKIYKLTEEHLDYEIETNEFDTEYECAYTNMKNDYLIYLSHEGTITFSGKDLLYEIENNFAEKLSFKNPWA